MIFADERQRVGGTNKTKMQRKCEDECDSFYRTAACEWEHKTFIHYCDMVLKKIKNVKKTLPTAF